MDDKEINYLTNFLLDNQYNINNIPKKSNLYINIEREKKRRVLVKLHHLYNKLNKHRNRINKFINKNLNENLESNDFFNLLEKKPLDKLNKLLDECK
tara:strand:- start:4062 stop:4352 length:291 start_codon:yes stop_codon:yes gene_type:complete